MNDNEFNDFKFTNIPRCLNCNLIPSLKLDLMKVNQLLIMNEKIIIKVIYH